MNSTLNSIEGDYNVYIYPITHSVVSSLTEGHITHWLTLRPMVTLLQFCIQNPNIPAVIVELQRLNHC
ncbi:hypothetical protein HanIR_Chr15g0734951 [Helianthus annuus]|nr:hypothetical protein HanIR_Chr15g0734951 [Helianthus annuus]